jgi:hypothetical protein
MMRVITGRNEAAISKHDVGREQMVDAAAEPPLLADGGV